MTLLFLKKEKMGEWQVYYKEYELVDNQGDLRERTNPYDTLILECQNEKGVIRR